MTRIVEKESGHMVPVSVISCQPNAVVQKKSPEKDGYTAVVLGAEKLKKEKKSRKFAHLAEFKVDEKNELSVGDAVTVEHFKGIERVRVTGTSKGRGFSGVIKRHNFSRGPETHGSHHHRKPGSSSGAVSGTGRVPKGKRFPGHYGVDRVTLRSIPVVSIDTEHNLLVVKGPLPGSKKAFLPSLQA